MSRSEIRNAVVLVIDRLGADLLGAYGSTLFETPNFNRLAAQSLLFDQFEINIEFLENNNSSITPEKGKILHLPWWKYKDIRYNMDHKIDAIIINHAVSEMDPSALRHTLKAALSL